MAKAAREVLKRLTAPEIREILREELNGALRVIDTRFESVGTRFESVSKEIKALDGKVDSSKNELKAEIRSVDIKVDELTKRLDVVKDVEMLKVEVREMKAKLASR